MADITKYLQEILDAVYGEEVRSSIHDSIALINSVGEKVMTVGTAVTSSTSDSAKYYDGSLYLNSDTADLWKCIGTNKGWTKIANMEGKKGDAGNAGAWVFDTEAEWTAFDKTRMNDDDAIMFLWDTESGASEDYMEVSTYVGSSATGTVHQADTLEGHNSKYYETLISAKANASHTHTKSQITDFSHTHTKSDITDFSHTHTTADITDWDTKIKELTDRLDALEAKFTDNTLVSASLDGTTLNLTSIS